MPSDDLTYIIRWLAGRVKYSLPVSNADLEVLAVNLEGIREQVEELELSARTSRIHAERVVSIRPALSVIQGGRP